MSEKIEAPASFIMLALMLGREYDYSRAGGPVVQQCIDQAFADANEIDGVTVFQTQIAEARALICDYVAAGTRVKHAHELLRRVICEAGIEAPTQAQIDRAEIAYKDAIILRAFGVENPTQEMRDAIGVGGTGR